MENINSLPGGYAKPSLLECREQGGVQDPHCFKIVQGSLNYVRATVIAIVKTWIGFCCSFMGDYFGVLLDSRVANSLSMLWTTLCTWVLAWSISGFAFQHASMFGFLHTLQKMDCCFNIT